MLTGAQRHDILARISTSRVLARAADLEALDRLFGGAGLEQAGQRMCERLQQAGAQQVELKSFPYGPRTRHFEWSEQRRPFPHRAELWLLTPDDGEILICRRADNYACCMGAYSSTAQAGEVFEVVDVGFGTRASDYRGQRMPGKLALASGHHFSAAMLEALGERQAAGLLCGPGAALGDPSQVVHNQLGDPELFGEHNPLGFNLSGRQYNRLVNLLAAGESVQMRAVVQVTTDSGSLPLASAVYEGSDLAHERVLLVADLGLPLGPACLEEVLRTINHLVVAGICPPPRRSLELLLVPRPLDTVARLYELQQQGSPWPRAALCVSVESPAAAARVGVEQGPAGRATFLSDLVEDQLGWSSAVEGSFRSDIPVSVRALPYGPGSPTLPFHDRDVGVPATWIRCLEQPGAPRPLGMAPHGPLHRLVAALTCTALELAGLEGTDLPRLLCGSQLKGVARLARRAGQLHDRVRGALSVDADQEHLDSTAGRHLLWAIDSSMELGTQREQALLGGCCDFLEGPGQHALRLAEAEAELEQTAAGLTRSMHLEVNSALSPRARPGVRRQPLTALDRRAHAVVVRRCFAGPLPVPYLLRKVAPAERGWLAHNVAALATQPAGDEVMLWVDSQRTLLEIADLLRLDHPQVDLKLLWRYLEVLQSAGLVELREDRGMEQA